MSHKKSSKNRSVKHLGDVTLNDFANSTVCKNRPKKSTNNVATVLKQFEELEKSWDEKIDEYEKSDFVEQIDEEGNITYVLRKIEPRRRKKTGSCSEELSDSVGKEYPMDIWFLLSEYIRPEDVGRFAGICRSSFEVVCTAKFWYKLYRRFYSSVCNMPEELQIESLVRKYGLRTSVIRALHYMYPPYVNKLKTTTLEIHPDILKMRVCESLWHTKGGKESNWVYYFKMREKTAGNSLQRHSAGGEFKKPDLLQILDDVSANPDENCRILQVICTHFLPIAPVIGQVLTFVSLTLSQDFRHHRLQLGFGSGIKKEDKGSLIILDPVISCKVLDWWHPLYPHNHSIQDLVYQD